jgi:vacuolar-type H+-ATPase subunit H
MAEALKVTSSRVDEMQKNPQEYFQKARETARKRAIAQLQAEKQRASRSRQKNGQRLVTG